MFPEDHPEKYLVDSFNAAVAKLQSYQDAFGSSVQAEAILALMAQQLPLLLKCAEEDSTKEFLAEKLTAVVLEYAEKKLTPYDNNSNFVSTMQSMGTLMVSVADFLPDGLPEKLNRIAVDHYTKWCSAPKPASGYTDVTPQQVKNLNAGVGAITSLADKLLLAEKSRRDRAPKLQSTRVTPASHLDKPRPA